LRTAGGGELTFTVGCSSPIPSHSRAVTTTSSATRGATATYPPGRERPLPGPRASL